MFHFLKETASYEKKKCFKDSVTYHCQEDNILHTFQHYPRHQPIRDRISD